MASLNQVVLLGRVAQEGQLRTVGANDSSLLEFRLVINERVRRGIDWVPSPVFVDVVLWGKSADSGARLLSKGTTVIVQGRLKYESWDGSDGKSHSRLKVTAARFQLLSPPRHDGSNSIDPSFSPLTQPSNPTQE
ncbi:MAG: single-stranded DNA-binding protein [Planctomycetales bacterium]|nr:single-stranded DNA-binding protein [Planctomycetales bacterium]